MPTEYSRTLPPLPDHAVRLAAGAACLEAALSVYLPRGLAPTCCCDPDHLSVGKQHAQTCTSPGKAPMHPWKAFQTRRPSAAEIQAWWRAYPIGNVGCVLGQGSGVVRVDVDGQAGETLLQEWSGGDLPLTWTFRSSSHGRGLLYAWPRDLPCQSTTQAARGTHQELRLQANGAQTVLPPSRHVSGTRYAWDPGCSPQEQALAPAPAWLQERLRVPERPPAAAADPPDAPPHQPGRLRERPTVSLVSAALGRIPNQGDGQPYDTWLQVGMALHSLQTDWARRLFDGWSQQSTKYHRGKQTASWTSFTPEGTPKGVVLIDNLFALARQYGWQAPAAPAPSSLPQARLTARLSSRLIPNLRRW